MKPLTARDGDETVTVDLDAGWLGVNERDDPASLATSEGSFVTVGINVRFRTRRVETRGGYVAPPALNYLAATGANCGAGLYVDRLGREWVALAQFGADTLVLDPPQVPVVFVKLGESGQPTLANTATGFAVPARAEFTQAGTDLILWRSNGEPLLWEGNWDDVWMPVSEAEAPGYATYLRPLPAADFGIYAADRVVFPYGSGVGFTGILEPRRWDPALQFFPVSGAGPVTGLAYLRKSLIVFKESSVTALSNFTGALVDEEGNVTVEVEDITKQTGCIARATIVEAGGELIWLGRGGVYRLSETVSPSGEGQITVKRSLTPVPVSWPIPKSMGRINWTAAHLACAVLADGLYYLSVPVDGSVTNNAVFVYDTVTGTWQGEDQLAAHSSPGIRCMVRTRVFGVESPLLISAAGVYAGGHGWHDGYGTGDIYTAVRFRGYALEDAGLKTLQRLEVQTEELGTWVALYATTDGIRAEQTVQSAQLRNRSRWVFFGAPARNLTNANDDATAVNREDYGWVAGDGARIKTQGIPLGWMQRHKLGGMVRGAAMWVHPAIASSRGRLRVCVVRASGVKRRDTARRQ